MRSGTSETILVCSTPRSTRNGNRNKCVPCLPAAMSIKKTEIPNKSTPNLFTRSIHHPRHVEAISRIAVGQTVSALGTRTKRRVHSLIRRKHFKRPTTHARMFQLRHGGQRRGKTSVPINLIVYLREDGSTPASSSSEVFTASRRVAFKEINIRISPWRSL